MEKTFSSREIKGIYWIESRIEKDRLNTELSRVWNNKNKWFDELIVKIVLRQSSFHGRS